MTTVQSTPYAWPWNGDLRPENTALIIIVARQPVCPGATTTLAGLRRMGLA